jgi:hypothetical protein
MGPKDKVYWQKYFECVVCRQDYLLRSYDRLRKSELIANEIRTQNQNQPSNIVADHLGLVLSVWKEAV